jgi:hypothetical protein
MSSTMACPFKLKFHPFFMFSFSLLQAEILCGGKEEEYREREFRAPAANTWSLRRAR